MFSLHLLLVVGYKGQTTDGGQRKHQPSLGALFLSFKLGCCKERKTAAPTLDLLSNNPILG